jgi:hypothetical protein
MLSVQAFLEFQRLRLAERWDSYSIFNMVGITMSMDLSIL